MKKFGHTPLGRGLAAFFTLALILPDSPAFALRQPEKSEAAGLEQLTDALRSPTPDAASEKVAAHVANVLKAALPSMPPPVQPSPAAGLEEPVPVHVDLNPRTLQQIEPELQDSVRDFTRALAPLLSRAEVPSEELLLPRQQRSKSFQQALERFRDWAPTEEANDLLVALLEKGSVSELLRWLNAYILLPRKVALEVGRGWPEGIHLQILRVNRYELYKSPRNGVPLLLIDYNLNPPLTYPIGAGVSTYGMAFVDASRKMFLNILQNEELSHALDHVQFVEGKPFPRNFGEL